MGEKLNETVSFEELKKAAEPLVELLRKKGNPFMQVVVTDHSAVVTADVMALSLDYDD